MSKSKNLTVINLRRLFVLRNIVIAGWLAVILISELFLGQSLQLLPIFISMSLWVAINIVTHLRIHSNRDVGSKEFYYQVLVDVVMLTMLLYFTGGSTNPFTLLFLLPLTVAAAVLPVSYTWSIAVITVVSYTALLKFYIPFPFFDNVHPSHFGLHVVGMWCGFVLSAVLIASFVVKMGHSLRERDRFLAEAKEKSLRDEKLVALGTLAAGTAHELGTPLASIAVLAKEAELDCGQQMPDVGEKLQLLQSQVLRCKTALSNLSASAGQSQAGSGYSVKLNDYLTEIIEHWQSIRPNVNMQQSINGDQSSPVIVAEQTLTQAIISVLNNAADASADIVEFNADWDKENLYIEICDRGNGFSLEASRMVGKAIYSTKTQHAGLGLGLYLAFAVVSRFNGEVEIFNRDGGGACTRVTLPLQNLLVPSSNE
ncbi:MAG: ATP-binding protein [Gammaproteobacteria bacterium]